MGHRVGLNYGSIELPARVMGLEMNQDLFTDIQIMEIALINESMKNVNR